jgi:hypothetical protein
MSQSLRNLLVIAGLALCAPALAQNERPKTAPITPPVKQPQQKQPDQNQPDPKQPKPTMDDWAKATPVAEEHKEMARNMVGDWNTESTFWFSPTGQPQVSKGHAKFEPLMGARFVTQDYSGKITLPDENGKLVEKDFKGHGIYGYNTISKEYECTWIDSTATGIMLSTGMKAPNGDLVFSGQYDDPMNGQKKSAKSVLHHESKDKMVFTTYEIASDGAAHKAIEVVYTRSTPMGRSDATPDTKKEQSPKPAPAPAKKDDKKSGR